jgi:hypothetical protein
MSSPTQPADATRLDAERRAFQALQARFPDLSARVQGAEPYAHTVLIVPSLSMDQDELGKIEGVAFYEERLLFSLVRLRNPAARVMYVTSQPVHQEIVDYYLQLLVGVPASHARRRLEMMCVYDASRRPLTEKILERPRFLARIREWIGDRERAYITCFNSSPLERRLAVELGVPLNGCDPDLLHLGTKSGSRKVFREAGVGHPLGFEDVASDVEVAERLAELAEARPGLRSAVVKLNASFSGEGNALFRYPEAETALTALAKGDLGVLREGLEWSTPDETFERYFGKLHQIGGIVEEFVEAEDVRSPSAQLRIDPTGRIEVVSTHEQVLGGATGQSYQGCSFPALEDYRAFLQQEGLKIGRVLCERGAIGRFGVDFLLTRKAGNPWHATAIEINLRMGGTTFPFVALEFLTGGKLEAESGLFHSRRGTPKYYVATDSLKSPRYRGLLPEDLMDVTIQSGLYYSPLTATGVLFHMIGALSQYGRLGVVAIGDSPDEAQELFRRVRALLDAVTA